MPVRGAIRRSLKMASHARPTITTADGGIFAEVAPEDLAIERVHPPGKLTGQFGIARQRTGILLPHLNQLLVEVVVDALIERGRLGRIAHRAPPVLARPSRSARCRRTRESRMATLPAVNPVTASISVVERPSRCSTTIWRSTRRKVLHGIPESLPALLVDRVALGVGLARRFRVVLARCLLPGRPALPGRNKADRRVVRHPVDVGSLGGVSPKPWQGLPKSHGDLLEHVLSVGGARRIGPDQSPQRRTVALQDLLRAGVGLIWISTVHVSQGSLGNLQFLTGLLRGFVSSWLH